VKPDILITAASLLFGFLFAGFWWALNRELTFEPSQRHLRLGHLLLLGTMGLLAIAGIILPLRQVAWANREVLWTYRCVVLVIVGVFGYMLTELGHYSVFQFQKYSTKPEWVFFIITLIAVGGLVLYWMVKGTA